LQHENSLQQPLLLNHDQDVGCFWCKLCVN